MELINGIMVVTANEIDTTRKRQNLEGEMLRILRERCILISPDDMRSPLTIGETFGLLIVSDEDQISTESNV